MNAYLHDIASLRIQTNGANKAEFSSVSPERYGKHLLFESETNFC